MTTEANDDDDRTVIRPPASNAPTVFQKTDLLGKPAGFQKTEWLATPGESEKTEWLSTKAIPAHPPSADAMERTEILTAPPSAHGTDMAGNLPVGTRLGEFEIIALIGEGGFGIVYLAQDHSLQRRVALKEYMPSSLAARAGGSQVQVKSARHRETFEAGLKSFINEARLLASFDHPSLVKVYRFWEANGTAYMVMPLLDGSTLKDVLKGLGQRPDEAWLRSVLGPLTEALLVIHAEQCYHRDIAPDNVMLLPSVNRWLLLDFGAARRVIGDMTQALTVILKPGYAPVEQYAEIPGMKQGPWTDVYALAAVVYFAIMGRTPPPSVGRLLNDTYVPLVQAAQGHYSERFLAAIDRGLAVRPEERTQSIGELRNDLGLGEAQPDIYTTRPIPPGTEMPTRRTAEPTPLPPRMQSAAVLPPAALPPPSAAPSNGKRTMMGVGIGAVVLGALGWGAYALLAPKPRPAPVEQAAAPAPVVSSVVPAASPAPSTPIAAATVAATSFDVPQQFAEIVKAQTPGFNVRLQPSRTSYRVDKDELSFTIQAEREGYVYVLMYGTDQVLMQLYPNIKHGSIKVVKGQTLKLPQLPDVLLTTAPTGPTDLLVMVSPRQRDHSAMRPKKDGAYRVFPTGAEAAALAAAVGGAAPLAGKVICPANGPCADEFGAALVRVEVVP